LHSATAADHRALDHHRMMRRLTGSALTPEQYAESLAAMFRPHVQLERLVHESRHHFETGIRLSPRIELMTADLLELAWPVPMVSPDPAAPSDDRAAWWGRVYVLEGSRLGGAFIARRIHASLGDHLPCRFFSEATGSGDYATVLALLERELEKPFALEQAAASARAAFAAYTAELDRFAGARRDREIC